MSFASGFVKYLNRTAAQEDKKEAKENFKKFKKLIEKRLKKLGWDKVVKKAEITGSVHLMDSFLYEIEDMKKISEREWGILTLLVKNWDKEELLFSKIREMADEINKEYQTELPNKMVEEASTKGIEAYRYVYHAFLEIKMKNIKKEKVIEGLKRGLEILESWPRY